MSDPVRLLLRALARSAADAGCPVTLSHLGERPWATATFSGARQTIRAVGDPASLGGWLAMLPEAELPMRGWFVASCAAELTGPTATLELLVLEE